MEKSKTLLLHEDLIKVVNIVGRFIPLRPSLPVLGNLLLKVDKANLFVSSTNLETAITVSLPVKTNQDWEITVPAKIFSEFLNNTSGKEVGLEIVKEALKITTEAANGTVAAITASEFPKLTTDIGKDNIEFDQKELLEAVNSVAFSASIDEGKPILNGILLKNEADKTIIVATDGYRLSKKELKTKYNLEEILLAAKTLVEVLKIAGELGEEKIKLNLSAENNQAVFSGDDFVLTGRLLSGTYPNFNQIIPTKFESKIEVNKAALISAIKSAAVFARDLGNVVKLEIDKDTQLKVSANTLQVGEGEASVAATNSGEKLKVAFNSRFLLDGLNSLKGEVVELNLSGVLSPALLRDKDETSYIYIVMPVKAQN